MMKYCMHCGKELHKNASFCPYCMESQIEKQGAVIHKKSLKKWLYFLIIGIMTAILIVIVCILVSDGKGKPDSNFNVVIETSESTPAVSTKCIETTMSSTIAYTEKPTTIAITTIQATNVTTTEARPSEVQFRTGDYITQGKTLSQIQGYGDYENPGGIVLTIDEIFDDALTFSIVHYSESGLASETVSARNITGEMAGNIVEFQFSDMLDGKGKGKITLENGVLHIEIRGETSNPTSIIANEYLVYNEF